MKNSSKMLSILISLEVIVFLIPVTLFYFSGLGWSILLFFSSNNNKSWNPFFLYLIMFLLIPGYGLYSLWWLVSKYKNISYKNVPRYILAGGVIGGIAALLFISPFLISDLKPPTEYISWSKHFIVMLSFGGGPIIILVTIFIFLWKNERNYSNK